MYNVNVRFKDETLITKVSDEVARTIKRFENWDGVIVFLDYLNIYQINI